MSKVKLVIVKKNTLGYGDLVSTTVELPEDTKIIGVARSEFEPESDGSQRVSDDLVPVMHLESINNLIGKLMTQVEASITDPEQRKAAKDIYRQLVWEWYTNHTSSLSRAWCFDKGFETDTPKK